MSRLEVNKELSLGMVVTTISKHWVIGIDTESLTMDEFIKRALFDGIADVNAEREQEEKQQLKNSIMTKIEIIRETVAFTRGHKQKKH
jgi:hypothetical protein